MVLHVTDLSNTEFQGIVFFSDMAHSREENIHFHLGFQLLLLCLALLFNDYLKRSFMIPTGDFLLA